VNSFILSGSGHVRGGLFFGQAVGYLHLGVAFGGLVHSGE
jgi:hypothetical protein